jgi:hypothetical protein
MPSNKMQARAVLKERDYSECFTKRNINGPYNNEEKMKDYTAVASRSSARSCS